jgi:sulfite oxidase
VIDDDAVTVRGYAWSGGGNSIIRVDITVDDGKTWYVADLEKISQSSGRSWAWALWTATVPVPKGHKGALTIRAKAVDESLNTQPEKADAVWNLRGCACNVWSNVTVQIE